MSEQERPAEVDEVETVDGADPSFERLLIYLRDSRGFDFTGYKRPSLMRRVLHRMRDVGIDSFEDYLDHLEVHPGEFTSLFNTILINVTSFFRDAEAWEYLSGEAIPQLLESIGDGPIRVWSAGCATGEEAYSLAMALTEALGTAEFRRRVKVYATDVDEDALSIARQASYPEKDLQGLPDGYLERYFEYSNGRYTFSKDLRRNVIFGRNDMVQDAPISRIDLLACRNALIYFNTEAQSRIVSRLGFALRQNGLLFLGKAEMLLNHVATFEALDLRRRVFRKIAPTNTPAAKKPPLVLPAVTRRAPVDQDVYALRTDAFLTSPVAQLVIDAEDRLALVNNRAAALLSLSERDIGRPFQDLEVSYRPAELRSPLSIVHDTRSPAWLRDVDWHRTAHERLIVDIQVLPLIDNGGRLLGCSIHFNDVTRYRQLQDELQATNRQLETAYEELQSTNEELETTNEELQSTVEELETTNEELQSTNEELETMNEELQSMNDELQATNVELRERTTEITTLNQFMESVLGSLGAAVVVVDTALMVQVWNRQAEDLWGLREDETVGRPFLNLDSGLPADQLTTLIRSVIADATSGEQTLRAVNRRGRSIDLRVTVTPLLATDTQPAGALILMESSDVPPPIGEPRGAADN